MTSFFNIAEISTLLSQTIGDDKIAQSMISTGYSENGLINCILRAGANIKIKTSIELLRVLAEGMADYIRGYTAPVSYTAILWDCCNSWIQRIAEQYGINEESFFEAEMPRPLTCDLGVELVKALHDEAGKTKAQLGEELGVSEKTIQTELRALDPKLQKKGEKIRPLRIAGQEMHPTIQFEDRPVRGKPHAVERVFYMKNRLHPIALQLNTQEAGTLLYSLFKMNEDIGSMLSREMALDVWFQLSPSGRERIYEVFGAKNNSFKQFINDITAELEDGRLLTFHTEEQQRDDSMSIDELIMQSFKGGINCRIVIAQNGKRISIESARILLRDGSQDL